MERLAVVALGGAFGSCTRYVIGGLIQRWCGTAFPGGTLVVNVVGSFLIAAIVQASLEGPFLSPLARLGLTAGFLGGFTTYSAFSVETLTLLQRGATTLAVLNVIATVGLCLLAAWLGCASARALAR